MYADDIRADKEKQRIDNLGNAFRSLSFEKTQLSERAETNLEIYKLYTSITQTKLRKIENWKRYIQFLKGNRTPDSPEAQKKFRTSKNFIKTHSKGSMAYLTAHLKTHDLKYVLSVGKDMDKRGDNFSAWLLANNKSML